MQSEHLVMKKRILAKQNELLHHAIQRLSVVSAKLHLGGDKLQADVGLDTNLYAVKQDFCCGFNRCM